MVLVLIMIFEKSMTMNYLDGAKLDSEFETLMLWLKLTKASWIPQKVWVLMEAERALGEKGPKIC